MTAVHEVRRLRIRPGPGAEGAARGRVLTEVARRLLGAELDEALKGLVEDGDDVELTDVRVRLELDPRETDEQTLAALWAGLIRAEVVRRLAGVADHRARPADARAEGVPDPDPEHPDAPAVRAADLARVLTSLGSGGPVGAADLRALAVRAVDDAVSVEALALLPAARRGRALDLLRAAGVEPAADVLRAVDVPASSTDPDPAPSVGDLLGDPDPARSPEPRQEGRRHDPRPGGPPDPGATPPEVEPDPATGPALSSYGGLVLLHHRLRPLLEHACSAAPYADPVGVRLEVLAALARPAPTPTDPRPVRDDPLLRLLAGDPDWLSPDARPVAHVDVDQEAADAVLGAFAGDLPGFAGSTPEFVRREWIDRRAVLVPEHDAVLLRLGPRPLDLLLDRLPYPIGAFRLPWTPTLLVGWEGG